MKLNRVVTIKFRMHSQEPGEAIKNYLTHYHEHVMGGLGLGVDKLLAWSQPPDIQLDLISVAEVDVHDEPPEPGG